MFKSLPFRILVAIILPFAIIFGYRPADYPDTWSDRNENEYEYE